ncbi:hypothetical protein OROMI_016183 [Orobanche minor]
MGITVGGLEDDNLDYYGGGLVEAAFAGGQRRKKER